MVLQASALLNVATPERNKWLKGKSIVAISQFDPSGTAYTFDVAEEYREIFADNRRRLKEILFAFQLANLFFEPSTRTSSSFASAMFALGGDVISINGVTYSSMEKGEDLIHTVLTEQEYVDAIVLRHKDVGSAAKAAGRLGIPLINGGDGEGEHPTQALLDLYTILREQKRINGLTITLIGDLKRGRTVHSLTELLLSYDVRLNFVAPEVSRMPVHIIEKVKASGVPYQEYTDLHEVQKTTDVFYMTRVQKERFDSEEEYNKVKGLYRIDMAFMAGIKSDAKLMHPLPCLDEIAREVDVHPNAAYFRQVGNGKFIRMALLAMVLGQA